MRHEREQNNCILLKFKPEATRRPRLLVTKGEVIDIDTTARMKRYIADSSTEMIYKLKSLYLQMADSMILPGKKRGIRCMDNKTQLERFWQFEFDTFGNICYLGYEEDNPNDLSEKTIKIWKSKKKHKFEEHKLIKDKKSKNKYKKKNVQEKIGYESVLVLNKLVNEFPSAQSLRN